MDRSNGFTLIELLYTVGLAAVLLAIGVPSFVNSVRNSSMVGTSNSLVTALHTARSEAVKRRARVTVCPGKSSGGTVVCGADGDQLLVFVNQDNDATYDDANGDVLVGLHDWRRGSVQAHGNDLPGYVSFAPSGFTRAIDGSPIAGNLVLCDARGNSAARIMTLSATGRPQIRKHSDVPGAPGCP